MKTKLFILICLIFAFTLNAQEIKLPKKVKDTFTKLYPKATEVKWDEEGDEEFEAGFVNEGVKTSVVLTTKVKFWKLKL